MRGAASPPPLPPTLSPLIHTPPHRQVKGAQERVIALKAAVLRGEQTVTQLLEAMISQ